jgi:hypothetical protein
MDHLDAMQVMLTAVECGSLSKASRKLGQSLAPVSRMPSLRQPRHRYITGLDQGRAAVSTEMRMASDLVCYCQRVGSVHINRMRQLRPSPPDTSQDDRDLCVVFLVTRLVGSMASVPAG